MLRQNYLPQSTAGRGLGCSLQPAEAAEVGVQEVLCYEVVGRAVLWHLLQKVSKD